MSRAFRVSAAVLSAILWCGAAASAETLRCQSVNGNLNCAGSGGVSCQTINGRQVCSSGHGDVVQSFGASGASGALDDPDDAPDNTAPDDRAPNDRAPDHRAPDHRAPNDRAPDGGLRLEQHGPGGHAMLLERNGTTLHLRTDRLSIDRD